MKKIFTILVLLSVFILASCSSSSDTSSQAAGVNEVGTPSGSAAESGTDADNTEKAENIYETIAGSVTLPELNALSEKYLLNTYGIDTSLCSSYVFYRSTDVTDGTTIALFFANDEADAETIKAALENAKAYDTQSADGYNPETYEQFTSSEILTDGNLVYWIVADDTEQIYEIIEEASK